MLRQTLLATLVFSAGCSRGVPEPAVPELPEPVTHEPEPAPLAYENLRWAESPVVGPPGKTVAEGVSGTRTRQLYCPEGEAVVGVHTYGGRRLAGVSLACGVPSGSDSSQSALVGTSAEIAETTMCDVGQRVIGVIGLFGQTLTALRPVCGAYDMSEDEREIAALDTAADYHASNSNQDWSFRGTCEAGTGAVGATITSGALVTGFTLLCGMESPGPRPVVEEMPSRVVVDDGLGWARIEAAPRGAVTLNGEIVAFDTPAMVPIPPGRHELTMVWSDSVSGAKTVQIEPNNETIVYFSESD